MHAPHNILHILWQMRLAHLPQNKIKFCAAQPREYPAREGKSSDLLLSRPEGDGQRSDHEDNPCMNCNRDTFHSLQIFELF